MMISMKKGNRDDKQNVVWEDCMILKEEYAGCKRQEDETWAS